MSKIKALLIGTVIAVGAFIGGIKVYKSNNALKFMDKCYVIDQGTLVFATVAYKLDKLDLDGTYTIQFLVNGFIPGQSEIPQSTLENDIIPYAEEFPCYESEDTE